MRFDPTAQHIASGSMDRSIRMFFFFFFFWKIALSDTVSSSLMEYIWSMRKLWLFEWSSKRGS